MNRVESRVWIMQKLKMAKYQGVTTAQVLRQV